jgi:2,4-dienoyl-CoA reductase-like NADH-dependent reductase (Old Yellow Enzyme family)
VATSDGLLGPSGMVGTMGETPTQRDKPATDEELVDAIEAYATAAASAHQLGFDGVELQGAHGYLIDQFFWSATNRRDDRFGGDVAGRTAFAVEIVKEIKRRTSPQFPVILRISQFKMQDFGAQLFETPHDLERFVGPLNDAGVDAYHCSQRRFWEGEFGSDLNLAGWTKRLSGRPTISVGSLMLSGDIFETMMTGSETSHNLHLLLDMMERGDFDMIAVGRGLLVDPEWARKVRTHAPLSPYSPMALGSLS